MKRYVLIGCGKEKSNRQTAACDLYTGPLFTARRRYAEQSRCPWWIVSAKFGLVHPMALIKPYDLTISGLPLVDQAAWQLRTVAQFLDELDDADDLSMTIEMHAGADYSEPLIATLLLIGIKTTWPVKGMGIGEQLHWYSQRSKEAA